MRVTMQCGRQGSAVHNMHRHIDRDNRDVKIISYVGRGADLRDIELQYYRETFGVALDARNARYRAQRHPERCRTIEQVYTARKTRPEEVILQVGRTGDTINRETFETVLRDFMRQYNAWNDRMGRPARTLDISMHYDEATPHAHWRRVWQYRDAQGNMQVGQAQALRSAGIKAPSPGAENRYNNPKMTYDAQVRALWQSACRAHGLDIATEPLPSHRHKSTEDYIDSCIQGKMEQVTALDTQIATRTQQVARVEQDLHNLQDTAARARREAFETSEKLRGVESTLENKQRMLNRVEDILDGAEQAAAVVAPGIRGEIQRIRGDVRDISADIRAQQR